MRVAVLTNRVPDYRRPIFERVLAALPVKLAIFLSQPEHCSDAQARRSLPLRYSRGFNIPLRSKHRSVTTFQVESAPVPILLLRDLLRFRPDLIISGEFGLRSLVGWAVSRLLGVPLVLWSEETTAAAAKISSLQLWIRRFLIPAADRYLAWGLPASEYLQTFGIDHQCIHYCAQAVDNGLWRDRVEAVDRNRARINLGLTGKVFLLVGRQIALKGFDRFLWAWWALPQNLQSANSVLMVGDGEEAANLRQLAGALGLSNVFFAGPRQGAELAECYAAADVFVMPSLVDVWGLVINEALACGLPVLASRHAGAAQELGRKAGAEGVVELFDPLDQPDFTARLARRCEAAGADPAAARALIEPLHFGVTVDAFREVIEISARRRRDSATGSGAAVRP